MFSCTQQQQIVRLSQRRKSLIEQHQAVVEADSAIAATAASAAAAAAAAAAAEAEAAEAEAGTDETDTRAADAMAVAEVAAAAATEAADAAARAVERSRHRGQGPRLWGCLKYVFEDLVPPGPGQQPQEDGLCEGGGPAIDVLSQGWIRKGVVLAKRIKAFWFTFNAADGEAVGELIKTHTTPAEWVRAGYAVVSTLETLTDRVLFADKHSLSSIRTSGRSSRRMLPYPVSPSTRSWTRAPRFSSAG